jgi:hypothetical protein
MYDGVTLFNCYRMNAKSRKLRNSTLGKAERLGEVNGLVAKADGSIKNLSSIAFDAEDKADGMKVLLLGDSTAQMFYNDYITTRVSTNYSLMKVKFSFPSIYHG